MSLLYDKFNIVKPIMVELNDKDIMSFFENYIINSNIILHPSLVYDYISNEKNYIDNLYININNILVNYIRNNRNCLKNMIKQYHKTLNSKHLNSDMVTNMFKQFITMGHNINYYFSNNTSIGKPDLLSIFYCNLIYIIIKDDVLKDIIIILFNNKDNIKELYNVLNIIDKYIRKEGIEDNIKDFMTNVMLTILDNNNDLPIDSEFIKNINILKLKLHKYNEIKKYFNFMNNDNFNTLSVSIYTNIDTLTSMLDLTSMIEFIKCYKSLLLQINDVGLRLALGLETLKIENDILYYNNTKTNFNDIIIFFENINEYIKEKDFLTIIFKKNNCIFNNEMIIKNICENINNNINKNYNSNNSMHYKIASMCKNIDLVMKYLETGLIYRIIYNDNFDYEKEENIFQSMTIYFKDIDIFKYKIILQDYKNHCYKLQIQGNKVFKHQVMTENMWNVHTLSGYSKNIKENGLLSEIITMLENAYKEAYPKRVLYHHLDIGYVDITFMNSKGHHNIILLPIQVLCLELIKYGETYEYTYIVDGLKENLHNYDNNILENVIESLVVCKLINNINNMYSINDSYTNSNNRYIFIETFNRLNNKSNIIDKKIEKEILFSRQEIIMANINNILKTTESVESPKLYSLVFNQVLQFLVEREMFENVLIFMQDKQYIDINGETVKKIYY